MYSQELLPDKELEERVLSDRSEYLASNLPADDVAPVMFAKGLLTPKEYEEFKTMKRGGRVTTTSMSEYLLECLRKRRAGFLKAFCSILQEVEPAKYLVDDILKAYSGKVDIHDNTFNITWLYCCRSQQKIRRHPINTQHVRSRSSTKSEVSMLLCILIIQLQFMWPAFEIS